MSAERYLSTSRWRRVREARRAHPNHVRVARESLVILLGALLYFWVRGLIHTQAEVAFANAETLIALQGRMGIFHEAWLQSLIIDSGWMVTLANWIYIFGHWPVIVGTLVWLVWRHTGHFALYRSALLLSGAIGLVCFVMLPMAPPRFLADHGFIDTVTHGSNAYRVLQPPAFTNQYAAMPSLHVGWNLLMGIAIFRCASTRWARAFGVLMPLAMYLATVVTANHYLLDGVVGSLVALVGLAIAYRINRSSPASARVSRPEGSPQGGRNLGPEPVRLLAARAGTWTPHDHGNRSPGTEPRHDLCSTPRASHRAVGPAPAAGRERTGAKPRRHSVVPSG
jgi:hypothetical protein